MLQMKRDIGPPPRGIRIAAFSAPGRMRHSGCADCGLDSILTGSRLNVGVIAGLRTANSRRSRVRLTPRGRVRHRLACLVVFLFAMRALVPVGFDLASDGSLSLVVCQEAFPPLHHSSPPHRGGEATHGDNCLFCNTPSIVPAALIVSLVTILLLVLGTVVEFCVPSIEGLHLVRIPQARAPPASS